MLRVDQEGPRRIVRDFEDGLAVQKRYPARAQSTCTSMREPRVDVTTEPTDKGTIRCSPTCVTYCCRVEKGPSPFHMPSATAAARVVAASPAAHRQRVVGVGRGETVGRSCCGIAHRVTCGRRFDRMPGCQKGRFAGACRWRCSGARSETPPCGAAIQTARSWPPDICPYRPCDRLRTIRPFAARSVRPVLTLDSSGALGPVFRQLQFQGCARSHDVRRDRSPGEAACGLQLFRSCRCRRPA